MNDSRHKPLILRGVSQVGKTTIVNKFDGRSGNYLSVNLGKKEVASLFELNIHSIEGADTFIVCALRKDKAGTLIFIHEIQNSAKAIAFRLFYERRYFYP